MQVLFSYIEQKAIPRVRLADGVEKGAGWFVAPARAAVTPSSWQPRRGERKQPGAKRVGERRPGLAAAVFPSPERAAEDNHGFPGAASRNQKKVLKDLPMENTRFSPRIGHPGGMSRRRILAAVLLAAITFAVAWFASEPWYQGRALHAWLKENVKDPLNFRSEAIQALGECGSQARPAVPALQECLKTVPPYRHEAVAKSLKAIDPAAAAKAGVK